MKLSQFAFDLPEENIALFPHSFHREYINEQGQKDYFEVVRRDESRLMVLHKQSGEIELYKKDKKGNPIEGEYLDFRNILDYFEEGDVFILNNTRVFPARLYGMKEKTDAKIEVFLLRELNAEQRLWDVLVEPARKIRIGNKLFFDDSGAMVAEVIDNTTSRGRTLRFLYDCDHDEFKKDLYALGESPLPKYIIEARLRKYNQERKKIEAELSSFTEIFREELKKQLSKKYSGKYAAAHPTDEELTEYEQKTLQELDKKEIAKVIQWAVSLINPDTDNELYNKKENSFDETQVEQLLQSIVDPYLQRSMDRALYKYNMRGDGFCHGTEEDMEFFQCVYAQEEGAVTAPATGLHFSRELMKRLEIKGIQSAYITLHCGLGNFNDIEVEDLTKHKMDSEQMFIGKEACDIVNNAKKEKRHVCAIGASVVKATETAVGTDGMLKEYEGWTNKFIFPPYNFGLADSMVANFYHPKSTLLMETAAFGGYDLVMKCYETAIQHGYQFGCFGDSLLILND